MASIYFLFVSICEILIQYNNRDLMFICLCTLADLGGRAGCTPPLWDPILLFLQTFLLKSACVGDPRPPPTLQVHAPPTGNPGSATAAHITITHALEQEETKAIHRMLIHKNYHIHLENEEIFV